MEGRLRLHALLLITGSCWTQCVMRDKTLNLAGLVGRRSTRVISRPPVHACELVDGLPYILGVRVCLSFIHSVTCLHRGHQETDSSVQKDRVPCCITTRRHSCSTEYLIYA